MKTAEPVQSECEVSFLRNIPQVHDEQAEDCRSRLGSFAMTHSRFLSDWPLRGLDAHDDNYSFGPRPQRRAPAQKKAVIARRNDVAIFLIV